MAKKDSPKTTEKDLKQQIKELRFAPIYVLYGEEQMLVKYYTARLVEAVAGKEPNDFNFHVFREVPDLEQVAAAMQVVPFMSEYNCVLLDDIFFDQLSDSALDLLRDTCKQLVDTTVLILSMPSNVPTRKKAASVFDSIVKFADKSGAAVCFEKLAQPALEQYIVKWANQNGKMISRFNAGHLISLCGADLTRLKNEVAKISAYAKAEEITTDDIDRLATVNLESRVFDLADAIINGRGERAFQVLDTLFYQKEEPVMLVYHMSNSYIDAYRMRVAGESGVDQKHVAADFGYKSRSFALGKAARATARVSTDALRKSLSVLMEADEKLKSTSVDARLCLEQTIARLLLIAREG